MPDDMREVSTNAYGLSPWGERNEFWQEKLRQSEPKRRKRERRKHALVLTGHNVTISVDSGTLFIRNGKTHFPQTRDELRFFPGHLSIPPRIVMIDGSGQVTFDAIDWCVEQGVTLIRIDWKGKSIVTAGAASTAFDPEKLRWQLETAANPVARCAFAVNLLTRKVATSLDVLRNVLPGTNARDKAIIEGERCIDELASLTDAPPSALLGIEGRFATAYFRAWQGLTLHWKGLGQHPIPDVWTVFDCRSSILTGHKAKNWKAAHPINAMLNYGYACLEADTRIKVISEGYAPRFGILHSGDDKAQDSFVFDRMEPLRPMVDRAVLDFALSETFHPKDFVLREDGVCRLSPGLAGMVAGAVGQTSETLVDQRFR